MENESLARTAATAPIPFFNVFKWQFENTAIFNFQLSIFNSPRRAAMAVNDRRYGLVRARERGRSMTAL